MLELSETLLFSPVSTTWLSDFNGKLHRFENDDLIILLGEKDNCFYGYSLQRKIKVKLLHKSCENDFYNVYKAISE